MWCISASHDWGNIVEGVLKLKKILKIVIMAILCIALVGCSKDSDSADDSKSNKEKNVSEDKSEGVEEKEELINIETAYGTLSYPAEWEDALATTEAEENNIVSVTFSTNVDEQDYPLFKVMICDEEGDSVGTLKDDDGTIRNVFVEIYEFGDISGLSEDVQNQLYAMQEGVNVMIENLK